jgi:hypothetical protein
MMALGVIGFVSALLPWVQAGTATVLGADSVLRVAGSAAAPAVVACAIVVAAAGLALTLVGRWAIWAVFVVAGVAGGFISWSALAVVRDPQAVALATAERTTGVLEVTTDGAVTFWPWFAFGWGVVILLAALVFAVGSRRWSATSSRHDLARARTVTTDPAEDPRAVWDAQTGGVDPTVSNGR